MSQNFVTWDKIVKSNYLWDKENKIKNLCYEFIYFLKNKLSIQYFY